MSKWWIAAIGAVLASGCAGGGGAWDGEQFRAAAEQQIRQDENADEVICETPASTDEGWVFVCRAPFTADNGSPAWNDYEVKIVGASDIAVDRSGSGGG